MNDMNDLETLLRSWALRRPSAKLKQRLFATPMVAAQTAGPSAATNSQTPLLQFGWLAPAAACCLAVLAVFGPRSNSTLSRSNPAPMVAVILSNQSYAAYLPGSFEREQNALPRDTFEWTNGYSSTSSMRSRSPFKTDD